MKKMAIKPLIPEIISAAFILLWVYAAVSKLLDYQTFKVQLGQSPLLTPIAPFVAWFIPLLELLIAAMLAKSESRLLALYASYSLMILFSAYIIVITQFSDFVPCSCGGILSQMNWDAHLFFNLGFAVLALLSIILQSKILLLQHNQEMPKACLQSRQYH